MCDNPLYSVETKLLFLRRSLNDMMFDLDELLREIRKCGALTEKDTRMVTEIPPLLSAWAEVFTTASHADSVETDTI